MPPTATKTNMICKTCKKEYSGRGKSFCSYTCYYESLKGKAISKETRVKIGNAHKGRPSIFKGIKRPYMIGDKNHNWVSDRSLLKKDNRRNDSAYKEWRKNVYFRDNFKCKIANTDCSGKIEAHHILGWKHYPELRYNVSNGITLCHNHHPRKKADESRMSEYFQEIINKKS